MDARTTERAFACESEAARLAVEAENLAAGLRIRALYSTFDAAVAHVTAIDVAAHDSALPVREYAAVDPWELARSELAAALGMHANRAGAMLDLAIELVERGPAILREMETGRIDERTASVMVGCLRGVTEDHLCRAAAELAAGRYIGALESGDRPGIAQLRRVMDRAVREVDPEGVRRRRYEAHRGRGVWIRKAADGMAAVSATLTAAGAELLGERLDQMAGAGTWDRTPGRAAGGVAEGDDDEAGPLTDLRSPDERRADALVDLATAGPDLGPAGHADPGGVVANRGAGSSEAGSSAAEASDAGPSGTGPSDAETTDAGLGEWAACAAWPSDAEATAAGPVAADAPDARGRAAEPLRPEVTVILSGDGRSEVFFRRSGEGSLAALADLLARAHGASFETVFTGRAETDPRAELRYSIPGWLARRVRLRDGTCRHPGCSVSAERCDLDHVIPFDHADAGSGGRTAEWNLMCLCRTHHRLKTFSGWRYRLAADGILEVTTETGRTVWTRPSGPLADARNASDGSSEDGLTEEGLTEEGLPRTGPTEFRNTTREHDRRSRRRSERDQLNLERKTRAARRRAEQQRLAVEDPPPF